MKQILNEWRKFLNEDSSFFGKKFVEYKSLVENGGDPLWTAHKIGLKEVGRGSSRIVFELPDNRDFVLKIINKEEISLIPGEDPNEEGIVDRHGFTIQKKRNANMYEADIKIQIENPSLFPKSTEYAEDYSWILVERVEPITQKEFRDQLGLPGDIPFITIMGLVSLIIEAKQNIENKKHYSHEFVAESTETNDEDETVSMSDLETDIVNEPSGAQSTMALGDDEKGNNNIKKSTQTALKENIKSILRNPQAVRILLLMAKYNIPPNEFKAGNMGISKLNGGKMVFLDSSMWDDKE